MSVVFEHDNATIKIYEETVAGVKGASLTTSSIITNIDIKNGGEGYEVGDSLVFTGGSGSGAVATVSSVHPTYPPPPTGSILGVNLSNGGSGYTSLPTITVTSDAGALASLTARINKVGWLYCRHVRLTETVTNIEAPQMYAGYNRFETIGKQMVLTIDKLHYDKAIDFDLAIDRTMNYWIEIVFKDGTQEETHTCKHCRHDDRSLDTQKETNKIGRRWLVGEVT